MDGEVGTLDKGGRYLAWGGGVGTLHGREGVGTLDGGRYLGVPPPLRCGLTNKMKLLPPSHPSDAVGKNVQIFRCGFSLTKVIH